MREYQLWNVVLRHGVVLIPTTGRTDGPRIDVEPVEVAQVADPVAVHAAIRRAIERGNPRVPTPTRQTFPKPVLPGYAGVRTWSQFQRGARWWMIFYEHERYRIVPQRRHSNGGIVADESQVVELPEGTDVDGVARHMTQMLRDGDSSAAE